MCADLPEFFTQIGKEVPHISLRATPRTRAKMLPLTILHLLLRKLQLCPEVFCVHVEVINDICHFLQFHRKAYIYGPSSHSRRPISRAICNRTVVARGDLFVQVAFYFFPEVNKTRRNFSAGHQSNCRVRYQVPEIKLCLFQKFTEVMVIAPITPDNVWKNRLQNEGHIHVFPTEDLLVDHTMQIHWRWESANFSSFYYLPSALSLRTCLYLDQLWHILVCPAASFRWLLTTSSALLSSASQWMIRLNKRLKICCLNRNAPYIAAREIMRSRKKTQSRTASGLIGTKQR